MLAQVDGGGAPPDYAYARANAPVAGGAMGQTTGKAVSADGGAYEREWHREAGGVLNEAGVLIEGAGRTSRDPIGRIRSVGRRVRRTHRGRRCARPGGRGPMPFWAER